MNVGSRRLWGAIFLTQLFAGAAGVLLPVLLFPGVGACWHLTASVSANTICAPEAVAAGPLVAPFILLLLPVVTLLLAGLDALLDKGFGTPIR